MLGRILAAIHAATAGRPHDRRPLRQRRPVRGAPPRPLPRDHGSRAPRPGTPAPRPAGGDRVEPARAGPRRREPEEHPGRPDRPGAARRRVRHLRRRLLRPRLLRQPPAAQVRPPAGVDGRLPGRGGPAVGRLRHRRELGAGGRPRGPDRGPRAAPWPWPASTARAPSSTSTRRPAPACGAWRGRCWRRLPAASASWPSAGRRGSPRGRADRLGARPAGLGLAGTAHGRGRGGDHRRGHRRGPSRPPVRRGAGPRPSTCATAVGVLAGLDVRRAVTNVNERIAPALTGLPVEEQAAVDARLVEPRSDARPRPPRRQRHGGDVDGGGLGRGRRHGRPLWEHLRRRAAGERRAGAAAHPPAGDPDLRRRRPRRPVASTCRT